jgi:hypothetical protein
VTFPVWKVTLQVDGAPVETHWRTDYHMVQMDASQCMDTGGAFTLTVEQVQANEIPE